MIEAVQEAIEEKYFPGKTIPYQDWLSLTNDQTREIGVNLVSRGLCLVDFEEEQFYVICYRSNPQPAAEQDSETQPLSLNQVQEILSAEFHGELTLKRENPSKRLLTLSQKSMFSICDFEDLGDRVASALRACAKQFIAVANAIDEAKGYDMDDGLYVCNPAGFNVGFIGSEDVVLEVLNARNEEDALRQARKALGILSAEFPSHPLTTSYEGPVSLKGVDRDYFEFAPDGLHGTAFEGCTIRVDGEATRREAKSLALDFIQWLQAQASPQTEANSEPRLSA